MAEQVDGRLCLHVQYPNRDPVLRELPQPQSLEDLRAALGLETGQSLLTPHQRHVHQQYVVEHLEQLYDGAPVSVHVPRRRIFISVPPHVSRKAVMWYPGATVDQIERAIAKAAGFPPGTTIELRDGEASVVLSTTIPNDTHLEVAAFAERPSGGASIAGSASIGGASVSGSGRLRRLDDGASGGSLGVPPGHSHSSPGHNGHGGHGHGASSTATPSAPSRGVKACASSASVPEVRASSRLQSSASLGPATSTGPAVSSASVRRERSPGRGYSPGRSRTPATGSASGTMPAIHQSAPEEHCVHILAGHTGFVYCLCGVGDILFTGSQDSNIMIWDLNNLQYIGTLPGHRNFVKCLCASYPKKILCSGSQDRTVRVWSLDSFSTQKVLYGHTGGVNTVLILEAPNVLVSGSEDRSIRVWDLGSYESVAHLEQAHLGGIFALDCFGPNSLQVVTGARDRSLKVWDGVTWQVTKTLHPPHYDGITSIAVANKHGKFYSASRDRSIKEWDANSLTNTMHTLHAHGDWVQAMCMSLSEDVLFSGSKDSTVKVWDGDLQCQDVLQGHRGPVSALTTVGNRLFSASHDRTVRVWRIEQYG